MERLSLRLRIFLFFVVLAGGAVAVVSGGLWLGYSRVGGAADGYVIAGLVAGFGILGLTTAIWLLFDENVAKPIGRIAVELRSRAHAGISREIDSHTGRFLGDLAPAAAAVCEKLGAENLAMADRIAAETAKLASERGQLAAALSEIPVAVLMVSEDHRITLYDGQAAAALEDQAPLGLGHHLFDYLDRDPILAALNTVAADNARMTPLTVSTVDGAHVFGATILRLGSHAGYMLTIDTEPDAAAQRPLVFDFSLLEGQHGPAAQETTPLDALTYVVFDLETTGLHPFEDEVVEIGAVRMVKGRQVEGEVLSTFVNPGRYIPATSTKVHGISDDMVAGAPTMDEASEKFRRFTRDAVLVAHNSPFDMSFIKRAAAKSGREVTNPVLDTVLLGAALFGTQDSLTLDAIAERLGVTIADEVRHTAIGDALATAKVFEKLIPILKGRGIVTLDDAFRAMEANSRIFRSAS